MLIPNGRVVYTDPLKWDTDGDSLTDGEEMGNIENFEDQSFIKKIILKFKGFNSLVYAQYFDYQSNPTKEDTDEDGIPDKDDSAKLTEGLEGGVIGELTIVSDHSDKGIDFYKGHSFLLYKSYIYDSLNFSDFVRGYKFIEDNDYNSKNNWHEIAVGYYDISPSRYVSIGCYSSSSDGNGLDTDIFGSSGSGSSASSGGSSSQSISGGIGGSHFNIELGMLYSSQNGDKEGSYIRNYGANLAVSRDITREQMNKVLDYCNTVDHYNFFTNNCAEMAAKSWGKAFDIDFDYRIWTSNPTPEAVKKTISTMDNNYKIDFHDENWLKLLNQEVIQKD